MISQMRPRQIRPLIAAHFVGNALALWLGYYWLGIGEAKTATLLWSFVVALFTASVFCWLHGAGFAWRESLSGSAAQKLRDAFRMALRNLAPLLAIAVLGLVIYALLTSWAVYSGTPAFSIASFLTMKLRKPVKPNTVLRVFNTALWLVRWVVLPVLILPVVRAIAIRGWRGFSALSKLRRNWRYWLAAPVLLLAALWLPFRLMAWTPFMTGFGLEFFSLAVRGLLAYLLFVGGLLGLELVSAE